MSGEDSWTEIGSTSHELKEIRHHMAMLQGSVESLEKKLTLMEANLREALGHLRQQSIIHRMSLPLWRGGEDSEVTRARAANMALRQGVPFPLEKAKSSHG